MSSKKLRPQSLRPVSDVIDQDQRTSAELLATITASIGAMEGVMANMQRTGRVEGEIAAQGDYAVHLREYRRFVRFVQFVVAGSATLLVLLAYFLI